MNSKVHSYYNINTFNTVVMAINQTIFLLSFPNIFQTRSSTSSGSVVPVRFQIELNLHVRCNKSIYENWIKGIYFARGLQYIKPFIKMILGDESTTEMSRNHLSAFSTSRGVFKIFLRRLCLARFLKPNDKEPSEEHLSKSLA